MRVVKFSIQIVKICTKKCNQHSIETNGRTERNHSFIYIPDHSDLNYYNIKLHLLQTFMLWAQTSLICCSVTFSACEEEVTY